MDRKQESAERRYTCIDDYVVYSLVHPCEKLYIGSMKLTFSKRILQHLREIEHHDNTYVARHFWATQEGHKSLLQYSVIDMIPHSIRGGNREKALRNLERRYILDFDSKATTGPNVNEELYVHL